MRLDHVPVPKNYFSGILADRLARPDNLLVFIRTTVEDLQRRTFESRPHHRHVLIINYRTAGLVSVDGRTFKFPEGHAILIHPFRFHHFHGLESKVLEWVFLTFEESGEPHLEALRNRVIQLGEEERGMVQSVVDHFVELHTDKQSGNRLLLRAAELLEALKQGDRQHLEPVDRESESVAVRALREIDDFLAGHLAAGVGVPDLARLLGISESHLRASFRRWFGMTVGEYLRHYRMTWAIGLLRSSRMSIGEVAADCGFASQSAFSRAFRQELGCSPRHYARLLQRRLG